MEDRICKRCGEYFKPRSGHYYYCQKCRKEKGQKVVVRNCLCCGKEFESFTTKRFCSKECCQKSHLEKLKQEQEAKEEKLWLEGKMNVYEMVPCEPNDPEAEELNGFYKYRKKIPPKKGEGD